MIHSFDSRIAEKVGVNSAIILNNLYFWVEKNKANDHNFYDGYYWTYNSRKAFEDLFPYFSARQVEYAVKKLIDMELVITGNYNEFPWDRTLWYAITEKGYELLLGKPHEASSNNTSQNCEMEETNSAQPTSQFCEMGETNLLNGDNKIVKAIPDSKPDSKPDNIYIAENFETLWEMLPPTPYDRKSKVSDKRKKELYLMTPERTHKAIKLYLKTRDNKYSITRNNFLNEAIENFLDKDTLGYSDSAINYDLELYEKMQYNL